MTEDGLDDREQGPRSTLVADSRSHSLSPFPSSIESPPSLPARSPLRPQARSLAPLTDNLSPPSHMPPPISRIHSSSISIDTLVDGFPAPNIVIDDGFVNEKPRLSPFLAMPRTPSPDKPLPITPSPATSSPTSTDDDSTPDNISVRDLRDSPPPSASHPPKILSSGLTKRTHALLELIESERAYASDLALIRQVHLPVALGAYPMV
jgi:dynamin-binding protein